MNTENTGKTNYQDRIVQNPEILVGKPVLKGTRIPVELVLAKLAQNPDLDELFADYPRLTREDVCGSPRALGSPGLLMRPMSSLFRLSANRASVGIEVGADGHAAERGE